MLDFALRWVQTSLGLLVITVILALLIVIWVFTAVYNVRRGQALLDTLRVSTRNGVVSSQAPGPSGFFVQLQPAPEPFQRLTVAYHTGANPLIWPWRLAARQPPRLVIQGVLTQRPHAELFWHQGRIPGRALGRNASATLWIQRRIDFLNCEYVTRGVNPAGLVHAFTDLQTRFGAQLYKVAIQADNVPEVEVGLRTAGFNPEMLPPLIATVRGAGRSALLR